MERIQFNTGRWYSEHGQRIVAVKALGKIYFNDIDRGILGMFDAADDVFGPVELNKIVVMSRYDHNNHSFPMFRTDEEKAVEKELYTWNESEVAR